MISLKAFALSSLSTVGLSLGGLAASVPFSTNAACASNISVEQIWTSAKFIEGGGVTNCGSARIDSDVQGRCNAIAENNSRVLKVLDYTWYNASATQSNGSFYDRKRSCKYRATYKCKILVSNESY